MKKSLYATSVTVALVTGLLFAGCSAETEQALNNAAASVNDHVASAADVNNADLQAVKQGSFDKYPNITIEKAFENFFTDPTWKYIENGTTAESGQTVNAVEFTGFCTLDGKQIKVRLQFIVHDQTFEPGALSFNDIDQSMLARNDLFQTVMDQAEADGLGVSGGK